jgi:hypothetical protein
MNAINVFVAGSTRWFALTFVSDRATPKCSLIMDFGLQQDSCELLPFVV